MPFLNYIFYHNNPNNPKRITPIIKVKTNNPTNNSTNNPTNNPNNPPIIAAAAHSYWRLLGLLGQPIIPIINTWFTDELDETIGSHARIRVRGPMSL